MSPQADDKKAAGTDKPLLHRLFITFPRQMWVALSHNLQWKLLALFLAVCLWVGLILQDSSLTRERVFTNVPLTITGADTLRRNGFIVTQGLDEASAIVKLKVDVPQHEYNDVTYVNYSPRIDLSRITGAGVQAVKVTTTSTTLYGAVQEVTPEAIAVTVEEYITNFRVPVQVEITGEYPEGFYGTPPATDISVVTVSGPESIVSKITRIILRYDVSLLPARTGSLQTALPLHYQDIDGNELDSSLLEPTSGGVLLRSIVLAQVLYPIKTLSLNQTALTAGTPRQGYEVKGVTASPNIIIAAGDETTLSTLTSLFLEKAADVSGRDASFTAEIRIAKPETIVYLNTDTVMLIVDIGPVLKTQTFENIPLKITGTPEGMTAATETSKVTVTVTGPELSMESMRSSMLKATVSAEALTAGTFDMPVQLTLNLDDADLFTYTVTPQSVSVTVTVK
ncbi:MAG: CdaR family protein [Bacillota bacterium]